MKASSIIWQFCVGLLLVVVAGAFYLLRLAYTFGEFNTVIPFGLESCRKMPPQFGALEDIATIEDGTMFGGQDERSWLQMGTLSSRPWTEHMAAASNGSIVTIQGDDLYHAQMIGFPDNTDFHPHGLNAPKLFGLEWLFVVSHRRSGEFIDIFEIKKQQGGKYALRYSQSVDCTNQKYFAKVLNAVTAFETKQGKVGFYATNWLNSTFYTMESVLDLFGERPKGSIVFCESDKTKFIAGKSEWECRLVASNLVMPNGIEISRDTKELYVVLHDIKVFQRNMETNELDLNNVETIKSNGGSCDNIKLARDGSEKDGKDTLLSACAVQPLKLLWRMWNPNNTDVRPSSRVVRHKRGTGTKELENVLVSDGTQVSFATGAAIVKNKLYVASFFDDLLVCDLQTA